MRQPDYSSANQPPRKSGGSGKRETFGDSRLGDDTLGQRTRDIDRYDGREWQDRDDTADQDQVREPESAFTAGMPAWGRRGGLR